MLTSSKRAVVAQYDVVRTPKRRVVRHAVSESSLLDTSKALSIWVSLGRA